MKKLIRNFLQLTILVLIVSGCTSNPLGNSWNTLIDAGVGLENFNRIGDANWRSEGGAIVADKGKGGHLVSKDSYQDFEIRAEFWAATNTNSGIFIRITDPKNIGSVNAYEVNIWDIRPDPKYGTGAIVDVAAVPVPIANKVGGQWNVMEIKAQGAEMVVTLNSVVTVRANHSKFSKGPVSLQYGAGVNGAEGGPIKWRKLQIRSL
jgi:hypothetical protein